MIPNSTKSRTCTAPSRVRKEPDTNLSDAERKMPTDRPQAGRGISDRSIELGRRRIPLISQRQRSASYRRDAPTTVSLETTVTTSKKQVFANQFEVHQCLAARGKEVRAVRSRRSRPITNETEQHSEVPASKEPVKTKSKVTFSSSAKKIDGGSRVRRHRSNNSDSPATFKGDRQQHARHCKCEIEGLSGLSLMQSLSICDQDYLTNAETASDSMRTLVSMSSYECLLCPSSLGPQPPPRPPLWSPPCA